MAPTSTTARSAAVQPHRGGEGPGAGHLQLELAGVAVEGLGELVEVLPPQGGGARGVAAGAVDEPPARSAAGRPRGRRAGPALRPTMSAPGPRAGSSGRYGSPSSARMSRTTASASRTDVPGAGSDAARSAHPASLTAPTDAPHRPDAPPGPNPAMTCPDPAAPVRPVRAGPVSGRAGGSAVDRGGADGRRADDPGAVVEDDRLAGRDAAHAARRARTSHPVAVGRLGGRGHLLAVGAHLRTDAHDARRARPAPARRGRRSIASTPSRSRGADDDRVGHAARRRSDVARLAVRGGPVQAEPAPLADGERRRRRACAPTTVAARLSTMSPGLLTEPLGEPAAGVAVGDEADVVAVRLVRDEKPRPAASARTAAWWCRRAGRTTRASWSASSTPRT